MARKKNKTISYESIESYLVGRLPIFTTVDTFETRTPEELIAEVNSAISIHVQNLIAMEYLYWYRRGITPVWTKTKEVREDINNKVNVNHAEEIVDFKNGYFLTQPAFYVSRQGDEESVDKVDKLNEYLFRSGKQSADNELVDWFHTVGKADLFIRSNDDDDMPFIARAVDPRSTFVAYSLGVETEPMYAVNIAVQGGEPDKEKTVYIDVWDKDNVYKLAGTAVGTLATPFPNYVCTATRIVEVKKNPLKRIPIIEYQYNSVSMGAFEAVVPLLDAISKLQSDRLDGVDQFIQSLLVFYNCELGEDEDGNPLTPEYIRAMGAVFLKSIGENKADLKEISSQLDQSQVQIFIDNLYDQVLRICGMPIIDGRQGNHATGQVALFDNGYVHADVVARNTEDLFRKSNRYFDEIMTDILREKGLLDIKPVEFKLNFAKNETANIQSKAQSAQIMLAMGMHPELAFKKSGISNDPVSDVKMSEPYLKLIWGDPNVQDQADGIESTGEEAELEYTDETPEVQARADERLALENRPKPITSASDTDGEPGTRTYYRTRNGRRERVRGYTKARKRVDEQ